MKPENSWERVQNLLVTEYCGRRGFSETEAERESKTFLYSYCLLAMSAVKQKYQQENHEQS